MVAFIAIAAILLFSPLTAHAALVKWDVAVLLNEDRTAEWTVELVYNETVKKTDYFLLGKIVDYEVFGDNKLLVCSITYEIGSTILCNDISARNIVYKIKTSPMVSDIQQNFKLFSYKFSVTAPAGEFKATVKLPLGSVLADPKLLGGTSVKAFAPETGKEGSDGRRIFVEWAIINPKLGETLDTVVVYEQLSEKTEFALFGAIIIVIIILLVLFLIFIRRRTVREILPVLTPSERKVVEILLREKGDVDQREIVRETDFSKTSVSRIITNLVNRGIAEKISKGRKNLIRLKKSIKRKDVTAKKEQ